MSCLCALYHNLGGTHEALSIRQPWATLVAAGLKTVECRTWKTKYRGPFLVCASQGDWDDLNDNGENWFCQAGTPWVLSNFWTYVR